MTNQENDPIRKMLNQRLELQRYLIAKSWDDEAFKQELLSDPKGTLSKELEQQLPENVKVQVIEEEADTIYLLIPKKPNQPDIEEELSEEALDAVAGGGSVVAAWKWMPALNDMISRINPAVMDRIQGFNMGGF